MKRAGAVLIAAALWALANQPGRAEAPAAPNAVPDLAKIPTPEDPAIRRGVLANGLRYLVMHADRPKGGLAIRLAIKAGSFEETDAERGLAHFIEHMAFRSTRDFPDDSVDGAFAGRGVKFGRDLNAETGLTSTQFQLDLPDASDPVVPLALKWLRDVADGVVFDPGALDRERGVVLAEKAASNSPEAAAEHAVTGFEAPGLRSTLREPIGDEGVLRTATPQALQAFYLRWYRPDNAVVAMVGDLPLDALEAKVKASFESWRADGPATVTPTAAGPDIHRGLDALSIVRPVVVETLRACRLSPPAPRATADLASARRDALGRIWRETLDQRLSTLASDPANGLIRAHMAVEDNGVDLRETCLELLPSVGQWAAAMRAVTLELRRFQERGPSDLEIDTAADNVRSHLRGDITGAPSRMATDLADDLIETELDGGVTAEPRQAIKDFDLAIEGFSVDDVRAAFARDWQGAGPLISDASASPPSVEALRSAWTTSQQGAGLGALADSKVAVWDYDFGKPGEVASRETVALGQFVRVKYRNGVVLNFKQTSYAKNGVDLIVRFGNGRKEIPSRDALVATLGATLFSLGGVGKYSFDELQRMFQTDANQFKVEIADDAFLIQKSTSRPNIEDNLKVLAAYMSDPAFRTTADPILHTAVDATYRLSDTSPNLKADEVLADTVAPGSPLALPPKSAFDGVSETQVARVLKASILSDPIDITLVGDIDEKTAVDLVAATFGALPPRTRPVPPRTDIFYLRFPPPAPPTARATHHGGSDKALTEAVWPLYVATPSRRREEFAIDLVAAIFDDALRRRVRVDLGKSYAPSVSAHTPDGADQGQLVALVESRPADIDLMSNEIRAVAARIRDGGITQEQLDDARAPLLAENSQAMNTNSRWAIGLSGSAADDQNLRDILSFADIYGSLSLDEVKKAAANWLAATPWTVIVTPADAPAAAP